MLILVSLSTTRFSRFLWSFSWWCCRIISWRL